MMILRHCLTNVPHWTRSDARWAGVVAGLAAATLAHRASAQECDPVIEYVSVDSEGRQAENLGLATTPAISGDGRVFAFASMSNSFDDRVPGDNTQRLGYVRSQGRTWLVTADNDGNPPTLESSGETYDMVLDYDGDHVAFTDRSSLLVEGDACPYNDVFVRDLSRDRIEIVSRRDGEFGINYCGHSPSMDGSARWVAFVGSSRLFEDGGPSFGQIVLRDRQLHRTILVSAAANGDYGDRDSRRPKLSANGEFIVFETDAKNLDSAGIHGVFVYTRASGALERVSLDADGHAIGGRAPSISASGRYVAFDAPDGRILVRDREAGRTIAMPRDGREPVLNAHLEADGRVGPDDGRYVVYLRDGAEPSSSGVFMYDFERGADARVTQSWTGEPSVGGQHQPNADATRVIFTSGGRLVEGDVGITTDIYLRTFAPRWTVGEHYRAGDEVSLFHDVVVEPGEPAPSGPELDGLRYVANVNLDAYAHQPPYADGILGGIWRRATDCTEGSPTPEWQAHHVYAVDALVVHEGRDYRCRQGHTSLPGWEPNVVPALWEEVH